jgi:hypothetical protein
MSDLPTAGDSGWSDPDTLGAIPPVVSITYCGHCGESASKKNHVLCRERLKLEPPRYCASCRRRMKVQVTPGGWVAECSKHGETSGSTWQS